MIDKLERAAIVLAVVIIIALVLLIFDFKIQFAFFEDWSFAIRLTGCVPPGNCIW